MATEWFSFKKILQQRKVVVIDDNIHSREDAVVNALKVLDSFKLSFRYEFTVPKSKDNGASIWLRALPCEAEALNDDERFSSYDVRAFQVAKIPTVSFNFMPRHADLKPIFPFAPVVFSEEPMIASKE